MKWPLSCAWSQGSSKYCGSLVDESIHSRGTSPSSHWSLGGVSVTPNHRRSSTFGFEEEVSQFPHS